MPSYAVSSTRLGSTMIIRTSSGVDRMSSEHDHRVDEARLARAGGAGDEQVRHLGEVGDDEAALHVLAQGDHHRVVVVAGRPERSTSPSETISASRLGISTPIADLPGIGRQDAYVGAGDRVRDVAAQRGDLLDLHGGPELDLVAGDRRAAGVAGDLGVDPELVEHLGQPVDDRVGGGRPGLVRAARLEHLVAGQACTRCPRTGSAARPAAGSGVCGGASQRSRRRPRRRRPRAPVDRRRGRVEPSGVA